MIGIQVNRTLQFAVLLATVTPVLGECVMAQAPGQAAERVLVDPFAVKEGVAVVRYQIVSSKAGSYDVRFVLRRRNDASFSIIPKTISGAVGPGQPPGVKLEARWAFSQDVTSELTATDYYFEVTASLEEEGGWQWWHYALGGVAVTAGVVVWLAAPDDDGPPPPASPLPNPPDYRPNQ